jgi:hypothetical protein
LPQARQTNQGFNIGQSDVIGPRVADAAGLRDRVAMTERPTEITFAEMREMGVPGGLVDCADYQCSQSITISGRAVRVLDLIQCGASRDPAAC